MYNFLAALAFLVSFLLFSIFLLFFDFFLHDMKLPNFHPIPLTLIIVGLNFFNESIPVDDIIVVCVVIAEGLAPPSKPALEEEVVSASVFVVFVFLYLLA